MNYLACDLGAESGRVILGSLSEGRIVTEEIHRFPNGAIRVAGSLRWDVLRIFDELKTGLRKAAQRELPIASVSVDSWGLDYVLSGAGQPMLSLPYHYRDPRHEPHFAAALQSPEAETIFAETGLQFMPYNSLYQLLADRAQSPSVLQIADRFLTIADYLHYLLCGEAKVEESLASTTQLYNPRTRQWSARLLELYELPARIFPPLVPSGTPLAPLLTEIAHETGLEGVQVVASCSHDTGAAVAAVPATGEDWAYLSSGTWSLLGVELPSPRIDAATRQFNFTNEAGFGGTTRYLKNIVGLWILQECRRAWARDGFDFNYATLATQAEYTPPFRSLINPNDPRFARPDEMPEKIAAYCGETHQPVPENPGQFTRCIYESLALLYRRTLDEIETATGHLTTRLHIVGGGSQSALLNQFAASASGRTVFAGPVEATALGNLLVQAIALGHVASLADLRQIVRASFPIAEFHPQDRAEWEAAYDRFQRLP